MRGSWRVIACAALVLVAGCTTLADAGAPTTHTAAPVTHTEAPTVPSLAPSPTLPPSPPSPPLPSAPAASAYRVTLTVSGDLMWHKAMLLDGQIAGAASGVEYDFEPLLSEVKPIIADADVSICHIEGPVAPDGVKVASYPRFAAPPETIRAVKNTGFDLCTTTSNHSWDHGFAGIERTLGVLEAEGIVQTGTRRTPDEAPQTFTTASGVEVAVIAGTYGHNIAPSAGREWAVDGLDAADMIARGQAARASGAELVLAAMHAGVEYQVQPNAQQVRVATALAESGVFDFVYGHHAHAPQPWTKIGDTWVLYGTGNLVGQHKQSQLIAYASQIGRVTFERAAGGRFVVAEAEYIPLLMTVAWPETPGRVLPVVAALERGTGDVEQLTWARQTVRDAVGALGVTGLREA